MNPKANPICPKCQGTGRVNRRKCSYCRGAERVTKTESGYWALGVWLNERKAQRRAPNAQ